MRGAAKNNSLPACSSQIFCQGELLHAVQMARLFNDSKTFVDMRLKFNPSQVLQNFKAVGKNASKYQLVRFVQENFLTAGNDLETWEPPDWKESPAFLHRIKDRELKQFATELNKLWKKLGRNINGEARNRIERSSLIVVDKPFIVPGGRFREFYYWDSFWVVDGLLICGMTETVKGMIQNFVQMVRKFGFVPNGGRIYYTNRSQPPFLIPIVELYLNATNDFDFVKEILDALETEHSFWITQRSVTVDFDGKEYNLSRYEARMNQPRPESYYEDTKTAEGLPPEVKTVLYRDLASAAESGWDFSTRWFNRTGIVSGSLRTTRTRQVIPVDLNAVLYRSEKSLERFYRMTSKESKVDYYGRMADTRRHAMETVMWDESKGPWLDYDLQSKDRQPEFFLSGVVPLWAGLHHGNTSRERKVVATLKKLKVLDYIGGVPTSLTESGEQWDFPNAWPPLQHLLIAGLAESKDSEIQGEALKLAQKWVATNNLAWKTTGHMFEKLDVSRSGAPGGGGEYDIQIGFGWTNGVVIDLLNRYPEELRVKGQHPSGVADLKVSLGLTWFLCVLMVMFNFSY